jgi:gluconolactonase
MSQFIALDPRFRDLLKPGAKLTQLATGAIWSEGPVYFHEDDSVIWSDIPNNRLLRWAAKDGMTIWRQPSNFENGHYRDLEGRLLSCEHGGRCISRTEPDGRRITLVDRFLGKRLNSPNDLVVKSDGTIWFTTRPMAFSAIMRVTEEKANWEIAMFSVSTQGLTT